MSEVCTYVSGGLILLGLIKPQQQYRTEWNLIKMGLFGLLTLHPALLFVLVEGVKIEKSGEVIIESPDVAGERGETVIWCAQPATKIHRVTWHRFEEEIGRSAFYLACTDPEPPNGNVTCNLGETEWDEIGLYKCTFNFAGPSGNESKSATIEVKSPPGAMKLEDGKLKKMEGHNRFQQLSQVAREKDDAEMECMFRGYPLPRLHWLTKEEHGNRTEALSSGNLTVFNRSETIVVVKLNLSEVKYEDRKFYICVAENDLGRVEVYTLLRVKGNLSWVWPLIGIIVEAIGFGAVILLVQYLDSKPTGNESFEATDDDDD